MKKENPEVMQALSREGARVPTADAARTHRIGGLTLEQYAEACVGRERELDAAEIMVTRAGLQGRAENIWPRLSAHAVRYGVPLAVGDLARTNRIVEWDQAIVSSPHALAAWKDAYARALVRAQGMDPDTIEGRARVEVLKRADDLCNNPLLPLERRRPGMTSLAARSNDRRATDGALRAVVDPTQRRPVIDPVVFPKEKLARVSDFVRVERALEGASLDEVLEAEGLDAEYLATMQVRWAEVLRKDAWLAEKHREQLNRTPSSIPPRIPIPITPPPVSLRQTTKASEDLKTDPVIFPGEKLAKLSDFVRLARAARKDGFLGVLHREGVHPSYYAHMCRRFDTAKKVDPVLAEAFDAMVGQH